MTKILCVAEKPSVAKTASKILSKGQSRFFASDSIYNPNFVFSSTFQGKPAEIIFTSVSGHIFETKFVNNNNFSNWSQTDPKLLFTAPINDFVMDNKKSIVKNIKKQAKDSQILFLWLDNDREGELIADEVEFISKEANQYIMVYRARFSSLSNQEVENAFNNPTMINRNEVNAAKVRRELDLRTGSVFTRFLTTKVGGILSNKGDIVSYGPCQLPTLGFIVDASQRRELFKPEESYVIEASILKDYHTYALKWARKRIFCKISCLALYSSILANKYAHVKEIIEYEEVMEPVLPLTTVELEIRCYDYLGIKSNETINCAEHLYQNGLISYPRTEKDSFPDNFDFDTILTNLAQTPNFMEDASFLIRNKVAPRIGKHSDNAHPPIYPIKPPSDGLKLTDNEQKVFDFICHHFLACLGGNANIVKQKITFDIGSELFYLKGKYISNKGWLKFYPYEKVKQKIIPKFFESEKIEPQSIKVHTYQSEPPPLLKESEILDLMAKNGIGTDATYSQHIQTLFDRNYIIEEGSRYAPTTLGKALVKAYQTMGFDFAKPKLRAELDQDLNEISCGKKDYKDVKEQVLKQYEIAYDKSVDMCDVLLSVFYAHKAAEEKRKNVDSQAL